MRPKVNDSFPASPVLSRVVSAAATSWSRDRWAWTGRRHRSICRRSRPSGGGMMVRDARDSVIGSARHISVLVRSALDYLAPRDGGVYIDGTFGAGGHTAAILAAANARVIGIDRDPAAIADGWGLVAAANGQLVLVEGEFAALDRIAADHAVEKADGVLLDLGVSSMQLDEPARGFSSAMTARSTCAWVAAERPPPRSSRQRPSALLPTSSFC